MNNTSFGVGCFHFRLIPPKKQAARLVSALLVSVLSLVGIAASRDGTPDDFPQAKLRINQPFVLREVDESLAKYGYQMGKKKNIVPGKLSYGKYKGRKGTVIGIVPVRLSSYKNTCLWQLQLDTGETVYARWSPTIPDQVPGAVFHRDINEAQNLIGKSVWVNWVRPGKQKGLITPRGRRASRNLQS